MSTAAKQQRYVRVSLATDRQLAEEVEHHRQQVARSTGLPVSTNSIVQVLIRRGLESTATPSK